MLGQEDLIPSWRRVRGGVLVLLVAGSIAAGCGNAPEEPTWLDEWKAERAERAERDERDERSGVTTTTSDDQTVRSRRYSPGDCVDWHEDHRDALTYVVDCDEPHHLQIAGQVDGPAGDEYPSPAAWDEFISDTCGAAVEQLLGITLDPYGRIISEAIIPLEQSWKVGDRDVWCGASVYPGRPGARSTEDLTTAEQAYDHAPGTCLSTRPDGPEIEVACTDPHTKEIAARVDFGDLPAVPGGVELAARCHPAIDAYLGAPPAEPWWYGHEGIAPESWDAGTTTAHCFVGQWSADGDLVEVTGSAKG